MIVVRNKNIVVTVVIAVKVEFIIRIVKSWVLLCRISSSSTLSQIRLSHLLARF